MPALKENKKYTIEDIMALPENEHAELIDGQIYYQAAPSRKHQDISGELYATIHDYIKRNGGQCKVYHAPFAVLLNDDDSVYIEPKVLFIVAQTTVLFSVFWLDKLRVIKPFNRSTLKLCLRLEDHTMAYFLYLS